MLSWWSWHAVYPRMIPMEFVARRGAVVVATNYPQRVVHLDLDWSMAASRRVEANRTIIMMEREGSGIGCRRRIDGMWKRMKSFEGMDIDWCITWISWILSLFRFPSESKCGVPARFDRHVTRIIILLILCRFFCMHACGQIEEWSQIFIRATHHPCKHENTSILHSRTIRTLTLKHSPNNIMSREKGFWKAIYVLLSSSLPLQ